jgi:uncharacterized pyridoxamine 5'-phosphate oxidase family protein
MRIIMDKVLKFLKDAETYYLATVEGDQPRVRPLEQYMFLKESFIFKQEKSKMFQNNFIKILKQKFVLLKMENGYE